MPNTVGAKKANRQSERKHSRNQHFLALYREARRSFEKAIATPITRDEGNVLLSKLYSVIDRLVKKNIIHANNGSRRKSQFSKQLKSVTKPA
ncbi:MAG TPA: 30S ribosomal protein S20 [bacterium]|nr:30S ribosomal protein S20 [bacterium]